MGKWIILSIAMFVFWGGMAEANYPVSLITGEFPEWKKSRFQLSTKMHCKDDWKFQENRLGNKHSKTWPVLGAFSSSLCGGSIGMIISHILVLNESLYGAEYERANAGGAVIGAALLGVPSGIGGYFLGKKANLGSIGAKLSINAQLIIGIPLFGWSLWFLGFHPQ